ncbi:MAG: right-handed parallel beta-helix repeat-containing protein, partial [Anaerolineaceae bacterium]|nr:right-handed parallel beta-helix repeat-containing protein [Anaerolineaceae bacterium]
TTFNDDWKAEEILAQQLKRVRLYADGRALRQVHFFHQLGEQDGAFWVEDPGLRVHVRMWEDANPNGTHFEITTREQVFAPLNRGLGFIRVSGFHFEYAADGVPVPQRAMLSAARGHHWIIENNVLRGANSTAIDVGNESWHASKPKDGQPVGHHILRSNHIYDCGFCGIAGVGFVDGTLVEHNLIEHIGRDHIERVWESAGLKFHTTKDVVIRRNVFRHLRDACGVWLDYLNENTRVTENVFYDIEALHPAIYIEVSHTYNEVDHNVVWNIRKPHDRDAYRYGYASGIGADTGEKCIIAHNLIGEIHNLYAISADLVQAGRVVGGRVGLCRKHQIYNNLLFHCRKRVLLSRMEDNRCDGNVYDQDGDAKSFCVQYPAPEMVLDFDAWQEHCGMDEHGAQAALTVEFDPDTLEVIIDLPGKPPAAQRVPAVQSPAEPTPGPFVLLAGRNVYRMNAGLLKEE